jgi:hypothetical protein
VTEAQIREAVSAFPGVDVRALVHVIEGAAVEAAGGLTAIRVVLGWKVITDRTPPGIWRVIASPISQGPYPLHPPDAVIVVVMCIALEAGVAQDVLVDNTKYDPATGEFCVAWVEEIAA